MSMESHRVIAGIDRYAVVHAQRRHARGDCGKPVGARHRFRSLTEAINTGSYLSGRAVIYKYVVWRELYLLCARQVADAIGQSAGSTSKSILQQTGYFSAAINGPGPFQQRQTRRRK
jgi:hypothetical protein